MKRTSFYLLIAAVFLLCCCQKQDIAMLPDSGEEFITTEDGERVRSSQFEQGHVRLQLTQQMAELAESDSELFLSKLSSIGATRAERVFPYAGKFEARTKAEGLDRWYDVYFDEELPLTKAGSELSKIENLGTVEYRPLMTRITGEDISWRSNVNTADRAMALTWSSDNNIDVFNDPYLPKQWHYYNDGSMRGTMSGCDVNVLPVWRNITTGRSDVIVSVVDGGIDFSHEDLAANMWHNPGMPADSAYGYNFVHYSYLIEPEDHGTHVAGTISAVNNNGVGVSGLAGGNYDNGIPGVKLMSCQIFVKNNPRVSGNSAAAIKWGADHGAVISQNSWGYGTSSSIPKSDKDAIDYFNKYAGIDENGIQSGPMKGGVVFFASGNDNFYRGSPASYEGCIAVSAVGAQYRKASYSNYGDWVDITAPGGDSDRGPTILSTISNNRYATYEGTSMACPHASGVAALIVSAIGGAGFTREMLIDRLLANTTDMSPYFRKDSANLINAYAAIAGSSKVAPGKISDIELTVNSNNVHFKVRIPEDEDDGKPYGIAAFYDTVAFTSLADLSSQSFETGMLKVGDYLEGDLQELPFGRNLWFGFAAYDMSFNHGELSALTKVSIPGNAKPVIEDDQQVKKTELRAWQSKVFNIKYYDPDGHDPVATFTDNSKGAAKIYYGEAGHCRIELNGMGAPAGSYEFRFKVTDKYGAADSLVVSYTIKQNVPPEKRKNISNIVFGSNNERLTLDLADYFYDADGENLKISTTISDSHIVSVTPADDNTVTVSSLGYGTANVTVRGADVMGKTVASSFKVVVRDANMPFDVYPNPVTDGSLYIRSGERTGADVVVSSASGAIVYRGSVSIDAFEPALIDMSACSTGVYTVKVKSLTDSYETSIVNIHND